MNNQMNQDGVNLVLAVIKSAVEDLEVKGLSIARKDE